MRWKYILVSVLILLASLSFASADSDVSLKVVKNQVAPSEQAEFKLTITNNDAMIRRYSIYTFMQGWNAAPSPLKDKIVEVVPGKSYTVTMLAQPTEELPPSSYTIPIIVESDSGEEHTVPLKVYLTSDAVARYLPAIKVNVDMDEKIVPTDPVFIKILLENRNPLDLSDLVVKIQSDMPEFSKEATVALEPLGTKEIEFSVTPNKFQQPKDYTIFFIFEKDGESVKVINKNIEIMPLLPQFSTEQSEEAVFLKKFRTVTVTNPGNVLNTQEVRIPVSLWQKLLVTGDANTITEDGAHFVTWEVSLEPDGSTHVFYVVNYRILLYLAIIVLAFIIFYLYASSPIIIRKSAVTTKSGEAGTLSELKIKLEILNKRKSPLKNLHIIETVPAIANVTKSLELGTLAPKSVRHTKHGAKVEWTLAELDGLEHRLITYSVKAKLNILGSFSLPRTIVTYKTSRKRKRKGYSNVFSIGE